MSCCVHGTQGPWPEEVAGGQWKAYPAALRMETRLDTGGENPEPRPSHVEWEESLRTENQGVWAVPENPTTVTGSHL